MENKTKNEQLKDIIENWVSGNVCPCGGGGTDEENKICINCNGTGIYDWHYEEAVKKIEEYIAARRTEEIENIKKLINEKGTHINQYGQGYYEGLSDALRILEGEV